MSRALQSCLYYLSWGFFALFGLLLNVFCFPLRLLPRRPGLVCFVRRVIRFLFEWYVRWFALSGVIRIRWEGFPREGLPGGMVYVANHPCLLDAPILLGRLPPAFCIFKPKLMRNPAIGQAAIMAEYVAGETAIEVLREAAAKVAKGETMLVFPEGTRTPEDAVVSPLRPGFALIAQRAKAPVQLIIIRCSRGLVPKGRAWWKPPEELPAWMEIRLDQRWETSGSVDMQSLRDAVEGRMRDALGKGPWAGDIWGSTADKA